MINGGYNGRFNRHGDLIRGKAKQEWAIGKLRHRARAAIAKATGAA